MQWAKEDIYLISETTFPTTDQPHAQFNRIDCVKGRLRGHAANEHGMVMTTLGMPKFGSVWFKILLNLEPDLRFGSGGVQFRFRGV